MELTPECHFRISPDVLSQEVRGETVLLDLKSDQYFGLDPVGSRIWQLVGEGKSLADLIEQLLGEYEVERDQLETDVRQWIESLLEAGLLERHGGPGG